MTDFELASIYSTGSTAHRSLAARCFDIINVKDYGALGNGIANDRAAIQAAFDAAFGSSGSPHGTANKFSNKPVYFPGGHYLIGSTLTLTNVQGGWIFGDGSDVTLIEYTGSLSAGVPLALAINGMSYSIIEGISVKIPAGDVSHQTVCIDLNWDNVQSAALTGNQFKDVGCYDGRFGVCIGRVEFAASVQVLGFMGSETSFNNCHFHNNIIAGCSLGNFNALAISFFGCKFYDVGDTSETGSGQPDQGAIYGQSGSPFCILGCYFENSVYCDINLESDPCYIGGCVSVNTRAKIGNDGPQFLQGGSMNYISSCKMTKTATGTCIATTPGHMIWDNCACNLGRFRIESSSKLYMRGCKFDDPTLLSGYTGTPVENM